MSSDLTTTQSFMVQLESLRPRTVLFPQQFSVQMDNCVYLYWSLACGCLFIVWIFSVMLKTRSGTSTRWSELSVVRGFNAKSTKEILQSSCRQQREFNNNHNNCSYNFQSTSKVAHEMVTCQQFKVKKTLLKKTKQNNQAIKRLNTKIIPRILRKVLTLNKIKWSRVGT